MLNSVLAPEKEGQVLFPCEEKSTFPRAGQMAETEAEEEILF
jgi:hypothetical protein